MYAPTKKDDSKAYQILITLTSAQLYVMTSKSVEPKFSVTFFSVERLFELFSSKFSLENLQHWLTTRAFWLLNNQHDLTTNFFVRYFECSTLLHVLWNSFLPRVQKLRASRQSGHSKKIFALWVFWLHLANCKAFSFPPSSLLYLVCWLGAVSAL